MPRYIVNNAVFNPIDFSERIKPIDKYIETYNQQEAALDDTAIMADTIGSLIDPNVDPELYKTYQNYDKLINDTVDNMIKTGDISTSRGNLRTLKRKYASELIPIQTGYTARQEAIKRYDDAKGNDATYIGTDPRNYGISAYMQGKSPNDHSVSGNILYSMGQADAKAASARRVIVDDWKLDPELLNQVFKQGIATGYSVDEIGDVLLNDIIKQKDATKEDKQKLNDAMKYLTSAYNRIADNFKINNFNSKDSNGNEVMSDNYIQAGNFILNGLISGMSYDRDIKYKDNGEYLNPLQRAQLTKYNLEIEALRNPTPKEDKSNEEGTSSPSVPYDLYTKVTVDGNIKTTNINKALNTVQSLYNAVESGNQASINEIMSDKTDESKHNLIKRFAMFVAAGNQENPEFMKEAMAKKTNAELLEDIAMEYKIDFSYTKDSDGNYEITSDLENFNALINLIESSVNLFSGKMLRQADNKYVTKTIIERASKYANGLIDDKGNPATLGKNPDLTISFDPDGTLIVTDTNNNNTEYRVAPEVISEGAIVMIGNTPVSLSDAINKYYKPIYNDIVNSNADDPNRAGKILYLGTLSDSIMRTMDAIFNSYPKVQSATTSKIE